MNRILSLLIIITISVTAYSQKTVNINDFVASPGISDSSDENSVKGAHTIAGTSTNVSCFGVCDGTVTITIAGTPTYPVKLRMRYPVDIALPDVFFNGLLATDFPFTITGLCGSASPYRFRTQDADLTWSGEINVWVLAPPPIDITYTVTDETCPGKCDGSIVLDEITGGTPFLVPPFYVIDWSNGETTETNDSLCAGNYSVTITDANSCTEEFSFTVSAPPAVTIDSVVYSSVFCTGGSGTITVYASGGTPQLKYDIGLGAGFGLSNTFSGLAAGTYTVTVKDDNSCTVTTDPIVITEDSPPTVANAGPDQLLCNVTTATLAGNTPVVGTGLWTVTAGTATVQTPTSPTSVVDGLVIGASATLTWTISNGVCPPSSDDVVITVTAPIPQTITGTTPICVGSTANWTSTTPGGTWSSATPAVATVGAATGVVTGVSAGTSVITYSVTVGGCVNTANKTVTVTAPIPQTITGTTPICIGATANWTSTTPGGTWSSATPGVATVGAATGVVTGISAGTSVITYSVTVGGCVNTANKTVTVTAPIPQTITGTTPLCVGATAVWTSTTPGGTWTSATPAVATVGAATGLVTAVSAGTSVITYSVTVGGCVNTANQTVTVTAPVPQTITGTTPICVGSTANWTSTTPGGTWSSATPAVATVGAATGVVTGVSAGTSVITYSVTVGGCVNTANKTVTVTAPIPQTITGTTPLCIGATAIWTSTTAGGTWSSATPAVATVNAATGLVTGISAGTSVITYSVTVGGCVNTANKTVTVTAPIPQTITGTTPICVGSTAVWTSTTPGGTWSSATPAVATVGAATGLVTGISAGTSVITYSVTVGGCVNTANKTVTVTAPIPQTITGTTPICVGATAVWTSTTPGGTWTSATPAVATVGAATGLVTGISAGTSVITYSVTVGGCVNTANKTVTVTAPIPQTITGTTPLCVGATAVWTSTTPGGTWTSATPAVATVGAATGLVTAVSAGTSVITYSVTVGGCVNTANQTVTVTAPTPQTITGTTPICVGSTANWTSTTPGGTWSSATPAVATVGAATGVVTGISAGTSVITYSVTVGGCVNTANKTVTVTAPIPQTITGTTPLCVGSTAVWTSTTPGGTWTSATPAVATVGAATGLVTAISAGTSVITYSVPVGGCVNTANQTVTVTAPIPQAITGTTPLCVGATAVWTSTTPGGTWTSATPAVATVGAATGLVTAVSAGTSVITYSVTVGGCVNTANQTVTVTAPIPQTITGTTPICVGSTATWTSTTPGGTWSSATPAVATVGAASGVVTGISAGTSVITYTVNVGGCINTANKTVTVTAPIPQTITGTTPLCVGATAVWTSTTAGGTWTSATPAVATVGAATGLVTAISGGTSVITYSVTVGGCVNTANKTVTVTAPVPQTITGTTPICVGSTANWTSTTPGGTWSSATPAVATVGAATGVVTGVSAGTSVITYSVTVGGCVNTANKTVTVTAPIPQTITGTTPLCVGSTAVWTSTTPGGTWTSATPAVATVGAATGLVTAVSAGTSVITYSVTVGGCVNTANQTVTVTAPIPQTITGTTPICVGSTAVWTSTTPGGTWSSATPAVATVGAATGLVTGISAGTSVITYSVTVGGCVNTANQTVTVTAPIPQTITGTTPICVGSTATWTSTTPGGTWSSATPAVATVGAASGVVTGISAGTSVITYTVNVGGCINTANKTVTVTAPIPQTITGTTPLCVGATAVWTSTTAGGSWTSATPAIATVGAATGVVTGVSAGTSLITYSVTVGGCVNTANKIVTVIAVTATIASFDNVSCFGLCDGSATVNGSGGTAPYTYLWCDGQTTQNATGLCAGVCCVTITDFNGCAGTACVTITEPAVLTAANGGQADLTCAGVCNGTGTITVSGGTPTYSYDWGNGETTNPAVTLCADTYTPTVTDANNCTTTASFTISEPPALTLTLDSTMSCGSYEAAVAGTTFLPDGSGVSYTSTLTQTDFGPTQTITSASDITSICLNMEHSWLGDVEIRLICPSLQSITLHPFVPGAGSTRIGEPVFLGGTGQPDQDNSDITPGTGYDYCFMESGAIYGTWSSEAGIYHYSYTDNSGNIHNNDHYLPAGSYLSSSNFTNLVGCPINGDWTIEVTDWQGLDNGYIFSWLLNFDNSILPTGFCNGTITTNVSGGTPPYSYSWSTSLTTPDLTDLCEGIYCVTVTDAQSCPVSDCATIIDVDLLISSITKTDASCNGICNGSATVNYSINGGIPVVYEWSNLETTQTISNLCDGWYYVTVSIADGCYDVDSVEIINLYSLSSTFTQTSVILCNGDSTGAGYFGGFGGTSPYTFIWSPNVSADSTASNLWAGTYNITITDQPGCIITDAVTLTAPPAIVINSVVSTNVQPCFGSNNGTITINASGGTPPLSYNIGLGQQATGNFGPLPANTYTPTVTDFVGCFVVLPPVTITQPPQMIINSTTTVDVSPCFGGSNGEIHITASGGQGALSYSIVTGVPLANGDFINLIAGSYTVTITDTLGCVLISPTITINQPASILIDNIAITNITGCSYDCTGSAVITASGGTPPYQYDIGVGPQLPNTFGSLCEGSYIVTVTDAQSCTVTGNFDITAPAPIVITFEDLTDITCFGNNDGTITIVASGGTAPLTYHIGITSNTTGIFTGLIPNTYVVTVTDAAGCTLTSNPLTISEPPQLIITDINITDITPCFGGSSGAIEVIVSGGVPPYLYDIGDGNVASNIFSGLTAGNYDITVTDASGCTVTTGTVTVTEPPLLTSSFTEQVMVVCGGGCDGALTITPVGGVAPYAYAWSPNTTDIDSSVTSLCEGMYFVTITDALGCSTINNIEVADLNAFDVDTISIQNITCFGACDGRIEVLANGSNPPFTYLWTGGQTGPIATGLCPGQTGLTVTDNLDCKRYLTFDLTEPTGMTVATSGTDVLCAADCNGTAIVTVSGGTIPYTFVWDDSPTPQTNDTATGLCANTYNVTVTDDNGCTAVPPSVTISEPAAFSAVFTIKDSVSCFGVCDGVVIITVTGGTGAYTYAWSPNTADITDTISYLCAGTYYVTVTDINNCTFTGSYILTEPTILTATIIDSTVIACGGTCTGTATADGSGGTPGYTFQWDAQTSNQTTQTATALCQGIFLVTVSDAHSCTATTQVEIADTSNLYLDTLYVLPPSCNGLCDGSSEVLATGGYPPYTYIWSNGQPGPLATALCADTFYVTVTDTALCSRAISIDIVAPQPLTVALNSQDPLCTGNCNGWIAANVSGGTAPYTYLWDAPLAPVDSVTSLCAGMFHVTVTDFNGCSVVDSLELFGPPVLTTGIIESSAILCYNECIGELAADPAGGVPPYSYNWTGGLPDSLITSLCSGVYNLTVTDANSCTDTVSYSLINPDSLEITFDNITQIPCGVGMCVGTVSVHSLGGTPPVTYSWTNFLGTFNSIDSNLTGLCGGVYFVTATDANNCTRTGTITIIDTSDLELDTVSINNISCAGSCDGRIEVIATGGCPPYTYNWSDGTTGPVDSNLCQGSYSVTVYDCQMCSRELVFYITDADVLTATTVVTPISCSGRCDAIIAIVPSGGTPPVVSYEWSIAGLTDSIADTLCADWYYYTITDAQGCTYTDSVEIVDPGTMVVNINVLDSIYCAGECTGSLQAELTWGTYPVQYLWDNGESDSLLTDLCAGDYIITVTDATLCSTTASYTLTQPDSLVIHVDTIIQVACGGDTTGSITISVTGGVPPYGYLWDANADNATTPTVINLPANLYTVTVNDANGCTLSMNIEVTDTSDLQIVPLDSSMITCYGLCNGSVAVVATGGYPAYTYEWCNGQTTDTVTGLCAGFCRVTVTDDSLCSRVREFEITQPDSLYLTLIDSLPVNCYGDTTGMLEIEINGGTALFDILWSNDSTTLQITDLNGGIYSVTVTDANGCIDSLYTEISSPSQITLTMAIVNPLCSTGSGDGSITTTVTGGILPYTFYWSNGDTTPNIANLDADTFYVTVTDSLSCHVFDTAIVNPGIVVDAVAWKDTVICGYDSVQIYGFGGMVFIWSPTTGMIDSTVYNPWVKPGTTTVYYFTAYDSICYDMDSVTITVYPSFDVEAGPNVTILYDHPTQLTGSGGTGSSTYEWIPDDGLDSPNSLTTMANPEVTTTYYLYITDEYGCVRSDSVIVTVRPEIIVPSGFTPNGDGMNDNWEIDMIDLFPNCEVEVYNRWGEKLYYSVGYPDDTRFDGTYKGKLLPIGTYYFIINLHDELYPDPITGPLTIMR